MRTYTNRDQLVRLMDSVHIIVCLLMFSVYAHAQDQAQGPASLQLSDVSDLKRNGLWIEGLDSRLETIVFQHLDASGDQVQNASALFVFTYKQHLGFSVVCEDVDMQHLVYQATARDQRVWLDDNIAIAIKTFEHTYNFAFNPMGVFMDGDGAQGNVWNSQAKVCTRRNEKNWRIQVLIPFSDLNLTAEHAQYATNIYRTRNGRGATFAEDTGWKPTNSLRGDDAAYFQNIDIDPVAFVSEKMAAEPRVDLPVDNNFLTKADLYYEAIQSNTFAYARVSETTAAVTVDGRDDEQLWEGLPVYALSSQNLKAIPQLQETNFRLYADATHLHVFITAYENAVSELQANAPADGTDLWKDDTVELYLMPSQGGSTQYLHFVCNSMGTKLIENGKGRVRDQHKDFLAAMKPTLISKVQVGADKWSVELSIPLKHFSLLFPDNSYQWSLNVARYRPAKTNQAEQSLSWSRLNGRNTHNPGRFGSLWILNGGQMDSSLKYAIDRMHTEVVPDVREPSLEVQERTRELAGLDLSVLPRYAELAETVGNITDITQSEEFLRSIQRDQIKQRDAGIAALGNESDLAMFQERARKSFIENIGGFPETKCDLAIYEKEIHKNEAYSISRLRYQSMPGHYVCANIYKPHGSAAVPTIIRLIGHSTSGKRAKSIIAFSDHLARNGYAVLVIDSLGQGERMVVNQGNGSRTPTSNHYLMGATMPLLGDNLAKYFIWDVMRGIDYLYEQSFVDRSRIILTGSSGGGTVSSYVGAIDQRLAGIVSVSAMSSTNHNTGGHDSEQMLYRYHLDNHDSIGRALMIAPRPFQIITEVSSATLKIDNKKMAEDIARVYAISQKEDNFAYLPTEYPHGFGKGHRELFYKYLLKYFPPRSQDLDNFLVEAVPLFHEPDLLHVSKTWRAYYSRELAGSKKPHELSLLQANVYEATYDISRDLLRKTLQIESLPVGTAPLSQVHVLKQRVLSSYIVDLGFLRTRHHTIMPIVQVRSRSTEPHLGTLIYINQRGKELSLKLHFKNIEALLHKGYRVVIPDLFACGELAEDRETHSYAHETDVHGMALRLGRSLMGIRVAEVLDLLKAVKSLHGGKVTLYGANSARVNPPIIRQDRLLIDTGIEILHYAETVGTNVAIYTAALSDDVDALILKQPLLSFRELYHGHYFYHQASNFVHGILRHTDIQNICAQLIDIPMHISKPVNYKNQYLTQADRKSYFKYFDAYIDASVDEKKDE